MTIRADWNKVVRVAGNFQVDPRLRRRVRAIWYPTRESYGGRYTWTGPRRLEHSDGSVLVFRQRRGEWEYAALVYDPESGRERPDAAGWTGLNDERGD